MGLLTHAELIREAGNRAGDTGINSRLQVWLRTALDSLYRAKHWSFTRQRCSVVSSAALLYLPDDPLSSEFQLYDVTKAALYDTNGNWIRDLPLVEPLDQNSLTDPLFATSAGTGQPLQFIIELANTAGGVVNSQFQLRPQPTPNLSYTFAFELHGVYTRELTYDADHRPIYPSDETILQALKCEIFGHMNDEREEVERGRLEQMILVDAGQFALKGRSSKALRLAPGKYGTKGLRLNARFGWMGP